MALALILFLFLVAGCSRASPTPGPAITPNPASTPRPALNLTRVNSGGGVEIQAILNSSPEPGSQELGWEITLDTHSVDLDVYDLGKLARLQDNKGREFLPSSWDAPQGGHHRQGRLVFSSPQPIVEPDTQFLELIIFDVAGVEERTMQWKLLQ